jgi:hypothetical protein
LELRLPYGEQERAIPVDIIVFDKVDASIKSYNVKRGNGSYDAGKRRIILEELVRTNMLLFEYAKRVEHKLTSSRSHIIFYYGIRSIPEPLSLVREDLDEHFGFPVVAAIEHINEYFSTCLHDLIENE